MSASNQSAHSPKCVERLVFPVPTYNNLGDLPSVIAVGQMFYFSKVAWQNRNYQLMFGILRRVGGILMSCPNCGAPGGGVTGCSNCGLGKDPNVGGAFNAGQTEMKIQEDRKRNSGGGAGGCFTLDMKVLTPEGWRLIGDIQRGELVTSIDPMGQNLCHERVIKKKNYVSRRVWEIRTDLSETPIKTTWCHPIFANGRWKWVFQLSNGDELLGVDQENTLRVGSVLGIERTQIDEDVQNLVTSGLHNFVVEGALVHNFGYLRHVRALFHKRGRPEKDAENAGVFA